MPVQTLVRLHIVEDPRVQNVRNAVKNAPRKALMLDDSYLEGHLTRLFLAAEARAGGDLSANSARASERSSDSHSSGNCGYSDSSDMLDTHRNERAAMGKIRTLATVRQAFPTFRYSLCAEEVSLSKTLALTWTDKGYAATRMKEKDVEVVRRTCTSGPKRTRTQRTHRRNNGSPTCCHTATTLPARSRTTALLVDLERAGLTIMDKSNVCGQSKEKRPHNTKCAACGTQTEGHRWSKIPQQDNEDFVDNHAVYESQ